MNWTYSGEARYGYEEERRLSRQEEQCAFGAWGVGVSEHVEEQWERMTSDFVSGQPFFVATFGNSSAFPGSAGPLHSGVFVLTPTSLSSPSPVPLNSSCLRPAMLRRPGSALRSGLGLWPHLSQKCLPVISIGHIPSP